MMRLVSTTVLCLLLFVSSVSARLTALGEYEIQQELENRLYPQQTVIKKQYIVQVAETANQNKLLKALNDTAPESKIIHKYKRVFNGFAVSGIEEAVLTSLNMSEANSGDIVMIEEDFEVQLYQEPEQEQGNSVTWGIDRIDQKSLPLDNLFASDYDGSGVDIYVIDTGVMESHQEFGGRVTQTKDFTADKDGVDGNGHGTHVAGTAAGATLGVAPGANIIGVKVLDSNGSGSNSGVMAGIDWVAKKHKNGRGLSVANLSLGGFISLSMNQAVQNLADAGVIVAVAAGNESFSACLASPASALGVITVGATTRDDERSSFSNMGLCLDIFAPGTDITSAVIEDDTATATYSGTSMASPHVAGAAALMLQENNDAKAEDLVDMAVDNKISGVGISPNRMLFTGKIGKN